MFMVPKEFKPDFEKGNGLIAAIAQDAETKEVLMLAWMNQEAWSLTMATGEAHYFSRSRNKLWHKGESSGHVQKVRAVRLDCDADAVLLEVEQAGGAACHEGYKSCFFRRLEAGAGNEAENAVSICSPHVFNPADVY